MLHHALRRLQQIDYPHECSLIESTNDVKGPPRLTMNLACLCLLEIDPLVHRQLLQVAPQAVQPEFNCPKPHPLASTQDA